MINKSILKVILYSIFIITFLILFGFYSLIRTDSVQETKVTKVHCVEKEYVISGKEKVMCDHDYYVLVQGKKVVVENKNTWSLITKNEKYDVLYEWHGLHTPVLKSIKPSDETSNSH